MQNLRIIECFRDKITIEFFSISQLCFLMLRHISAIFSWGHICIKIAQTSFFAGYSCLSCTVPVENVSHNFSTTGQNFDLSSIFDRFVSGVTLTLGALLAGILRPLWPIWCPSLTSCILPFFLDDFVFARHFFCVPGAI